jgi:siroheme synthase-like protein
LDVDVENVVLKIRRKDEHFVIESRKGKFSARAVVVSAPATSAGYLLRELSWSVAQEFDSIYYAPVVVVHAYTRDSIPPGFGFLVPRKEGKRILGVLFSSNIFEGRKGNLLTIYLGGATDPQVIEEDDDLISATVEKELKEILGVDVNVLKITKWKKAIPQYNLGYGRFYELAETLEKEHPGLFLTGNYLKGCLCGGLHQKFRRSSKQGFGVSLMPLFPAFIDLKDKEVLVVGGGKVATRKVQKLLPFGAKIEVVSPRITKELQGLFLAGRISWKKRKFLIKDLRSAYMVVVAVDSIGLQRMVFNYCSKRKILCNAVDSPDYCNFIFPALVHKGDVVIGISTSGKVPALSALLREKIEECIPKDVDKLLEDAYRLRSSMKKGNRRQRVLKEFLEKRMEGCDTE